MKHPTKAKSQANEKSLNLNKDNVKKAIAMGKELIKSGKSKAETSREIYQVVKDEDKEVILQVFQKGANLTEKGSLTYLYNIKRKQK